MASAQEQLDALLKHMDRVLKENGIETKRRDEIIAGFVEKVPELLGKSTVPEGDTGRRLNL